MSEMSEKELEGMNLDMSIEKKDLDSSENSISLLLCDETFELFRADGEGIQDNEEVKDVSEGWSPKYLDQIDSLLSKSNVYKPLYYEISRCPGEINEIMRAILIDWFQKVCYQDGLKRETFYASISHIDRILCKEPSVNPGNFQLYGLVALYLSIKTEVKFI